MRKVMTLTQDGPGLIPLAMGMPGGWHKPEGEGTGKRGDTFRSVREVEKNVADHLMAQKGTLGLGAYNLKKGQFGPTGPDRGTEKRVHDALDDKLKFEEMVNDKALLAEMVQEHLPIYKQLKGERNADRILSAYQSLAAKSLVRAMLFGEKAESRRASEGILDRVLGKPIERKMTMSLNVDGMTLAEVENELKRLASGDVGGEEAKALEATFTEGADTSGDPGGEVQAEPDTEGISRESSEDKGVNSGE